MVYTYEDNLCVEASSIIMAKMMGNLKQNPILFTLYGRGTKAQPVLWKSRGHKTLLFVYLEFSHKFSEISHSNSWTVL